MHSVGYLTWKLDVICLRHPLLFGQLIRYYKLSSWAHNYIHVNMFPGCKTGLRLILTHKTTYRAASIALVAGIMIMEMSHNIKGSCFL